LRLIKTAFENKLAFHEKKIFLGRWCQIFDDTNINEDESTKYLPYHWDDREKYYSDYLYLDELYEKNLVKYSKLLNNIHGVNNNLKYWRIVIGPWLRSFTDILYDRYESIRLANNSNIVSDIRVHSYVQDDWVPKDFDQYFSFFTDDPWNEIIYSECIKHLQINFNEEGQLSIEKKEIKKNKSKVKKNSFKWLYLQYQKLIPSYSPDVAIVDPNASHFNVLYLQLRLMCLPYLLSPICAIRNKVTDTIMRNKLEIKISNNDFEGFLQSMIPINMPKVHLELFDDLKNEALAAFPKSPKIIYTANAYQRNEGFKVWTAENVNKNTKLYIGQHGGNLGIAGWSQGEIHQKKISDKYFSWGWLDDLYPNVVSLPSMKLAYRSLKQKNSGNILLVTSSLPRYFYSHYSIPVAGQYYYYLQDQIIFLDKIKRVFIKNFRIRLDSDNFGWRVEHFFGKAGYNKNIDNLNCDLFNHLHGFRLCVCTHNATVFLQTMAVNFPTIIFWDPKYNEIRPSARKAIESLEEVGILHYSPESAAEMVNKISGDVMGWWNENKLQKVREDFVMLYAKNSSNWITEWVNILKC